MVRTGRAGARRPPAHALRRRRWPLVHAGDPSCVVAVPGAQSPGLAPLIPPRDRRSTSERYAPPWRAIIAPCLTGTGSTSGSPSLVGTAASATALARADGGNRAMD